MKCQHSFNVASVDLQSMHNFTVHVHAEETALVSFGIVAMTISVLSLKVSLWFNSVSATWRSHLAVVGVEM